VRVLICFRKKEVIFLYNSKNWTI